MLEAFVNSVPDYASVYSSHPECFADIEMPTMYDINKARQLISLLRPVEDVSEQLGRDIASTLAAVPHYLRFIEEHLAAKGDEVDLVPVAHLRSIMNGTFMIKFAPVLRDANIVLMAAALHPYYSGLLQTVDRIPQAVLDDVKRAIVRDAIALKESSNEHSSAAVGDNDNTYSVVGLGDDDDEAVDDKTYLVQRHVDRLLRSFVVNHAAIAEDQKLWREGTLKISKDKEECYESCELGDFGKVWYKKTNSSQPELLEYVGPLALAFLDIPATSVSVERLFNTAGDIDDDKRASLSPSTFEDLLFVAKAKPTRAELPAFYSLLKDVCDGNVELGGVLKMLNEEEDDDDRSDDDGDDDETNNNVNVD